MLFYRLRSTSPYSVLLCLLVALNMNAANAGANDAQTAMSSTELVYEVLEQCEQGLANGDHKLINASAEFLWSQSSIPYDLMGRAESCVSSLSENKALYTWDAGWQFEVGRVERQLWPSVLQRVMLDAQAICDDSDEAELLIPRSAVEWQDLTGDGKRNIIVHFGRLRCGKNSSYFSGSGGSRITLIVGSQVTNFFARGFAISHPFGDDYPVLIFSVHGSYCDGYGATNCILATVWGDNKFELSNGK